MNFEVFNTKEELMTRIDEILKLHINAVIIPSGRGGVFTLKWRE